jgi:hypothetical protein
VGLLLSRRIKRKYPLEAPDIDTGRGQVPGLSGPNIRAILKEYGIEKDYTRMGGRTTRSSTPLAKGLLQRLERDAKLGELSDEQRAEIADRVLEKTLVEEVLAFFAKKKLEVEIDLSKPGPLIVEAILKAAHQKKLGGPVAQHLVGAKLARRFPDRQIENYPATAPDEQLNRDADFLVGDAAFHVSVSPMQEHMRRCAENILHGREPHVIVPTTQMDRARALAEIEGLQDKVAIVSLEGFVGENIGEMGSYRRDAVKPEVAAVLIEYNRRVAEAETDQSIQIKVPRHLVEE